MFKLVVAAASLTVMVAASAHADGAAGSACAAKLPPDGQAIYAATMAAKPTAQNQREVLERETKNLAFHNKIARSSARDNAVAAEPCILTALQ